MDKEILLLTYAFRYALGRNTGALSDVMEKYRDVKGNFKVWQLESWIANVNYQIKLLECANDYFSKGIVNIGRAYRFYCKLLIRQVSFEAFLLVYK